MSPPAWKCVFRSLLVHTAAIKWSCQTIGEVADAVDSGHLHPFLGDMVQVLASCMIHFVSAYFVQLQPSRGYLTGQLMMYMLSSIVTRWQPGCQVGSTVLPTHREMYTVSGWLVLHAL